MTRMYRQGDVLLIEVGGFPGSSNELERDARGRLVLAEGEATGHAHAISQVNAAFVEWDGQRYLLVTGGGVTLAHEEHAPIEVPDGTWRVVRQRELEPTDGPMGGSRWVSD